MKYIPFLLTYEDGTEFSKMLAFQLQTSLNHPEKKHTTFRKQRKYEIKNINTYSYLSLNYLKFQPRDKLSSHKYDSSQYLQTSVTTVPLIMPQILPSTSFLIH
jgi:hypothetical protein